MNIMDKFSLKGKTAVVTGGRGLYGRQIAIALALAGAKTYIASTSTDELEKAAQEMREEGCDVTALYVDLGDEKSILALKDEVIKREGRVDILVNNAVTRPMKSWDDTAANFAESMKVNATGLFIITRAFGNAMAEAGSGSIINIGSIQGMVGADAALYEGLGITGFIPDYFFHKGGAINFTRFAASYYGKNNVRCNCVCPGGIRSSRTSDEFVKRYSDRTLLGRMAGPDDLMGIIIFLASDASLYITGANIPVDGGYTAK